MGEQVTTVPMMTMRGTVVFPRSEMPIYVGREPTMKAIRAAQASHDGLIAVFTQKAAEDPGPVAADGVYAVGTLCRIEACVALADKTMKLAMSGQRRIELVAIEEVDGVAYASFRNLDSMDEAQTPLSPTTRADIEAILGTLSARSKERQSIEIELLRCAEDAAKAASIARALVANPVIVNSGEEDDPLSLMNGLAKAAYAVRFNEAVALRIRILEENDAARQLLLVREALAFDGRSQATF